MKNELLLHTILIQLDAAYPASLPIETLWHGLKLSGHKFNNDIPIKELEYLLEKGFLTIISSEVCPIKKRYKLTTKGIDYLDEMGLVV